MTAAGAVLAVDVDEAALPIPSTELEALFCRALGAAGFAGRVSIALVSDDAMRVVNRDYHDCDATTDVLAFPLGEPLTPDAFHAEIVVSLDTAAREAAERGVSTTAELLLYVVHGTLHMLGYDDHETEDARRMHERTLEILVELGFENTIEVEE